MKTKKYTQTKHTVVLSSSDKKFLTEFVTKGKHKICEIRRARILLQSNDGDTDKMISNKNTCDRSTVKKTRARYEEKGLEYALYDLPRSGQPKKLDEKAETFLIATACSNPPVGHDHWTLELLRKKMITEKKVKSISTVALWHRLHDRGIKPWLEKNVVCAESYT